MVRFENRIILDESVELTANEADAKVAALGAIE
jgi:hypothetical protein